MPAASLAFDNTEPLASKQWYLEQDNAWSFWQAPPKLFPIRVAVIDSGVDGGHPELMGRVVAAKSFVGGSPYRDTQGHGTFVAGEIAANPSNQEGIAGLAFNAQLVVAKVVQADGEISLQGEVAAIRWAVDQGARVINLSLGGVRDPLNAKLDTYSPLEEAAIEYAYSKGVVVVAGGRERPAVAGDAVALRALPGRAAARDRRQRDPAERLGARLLESRRGLQRPDRAGRRDVLDHPAQPGCEGRAGCVDHPYSDCGPFEFRNAIGTSFAAPQVSAAAALLLGQRPSLRPEQVAWLLERSATDASPLTGCAVCPTGRDLFTGWGMLDVLAASTMLTDGTQLPAPDRLEPNDDAGPWAHALPPLPRVIDATLDFWDDNIDVYRVHLNARSKLFARLTGPGTVKLALWAPGTTHVEGLDVDTKARLAQGRKVGAQVRLAYRASQAGIYYLEVKLVSKRQDPVQLPAGRSRAASRRSRAAPRRRRAAGRGPGCRRRACAGATSFVTTAPAPTNASSPISTPGQRIAPPPMRALRLIVGPRISALRFSVRPM